MQDYVQLYGGVEYDFFYKQIFVADVVISCMMFGPSMPILIILGFVNLTAFYFVEKHALAKYYKRPSNYQININDQFLWLV